MASPPPVEDQARLLEDALSVVRQQTTMMRRCLETPGKLMDALKCRYVALFAVVGSSRAPGRTATVAGLWLTTPSQLDSRLRASD